ncbi:MAG: HEAT repeat domain-containing protein [Bacteroidetes bacterium]|nr:HEAT repeat domain-containing protein [Bacteroidota bacterium]
METVKNKSNFFEEVNRTWIMLIIRFGWLALIFMGYKIYTSINTNPEFSFLKGVLVFIIGGLGALVIAYFIALIITPLIGLDKKRILKLEAGKKVNPLLGYIHTGSTSELWRLACDAIVRLGNANVPLLLAALNKETCPVNNPVTGSKLASNSNIRAGAAYCLGKLKEPSAVYPLIAALNDNENYVRYCACQALGELGDKNAIEKLEEIGQNDNDDKIKNMAKKAIASINLLGK